MDYDYFYSDRARNLKTDKLHELYELFQKKTDVISFAVGLPDLTLLPFHLLAKLTKQAQENYGPVILQYGRVEGFPPLIKEIKPLLLKRGIDANEHNIHISTGSSGVLNNICMALLNKGDTVFLENPSYSPAFNTFLAYEVNLVPIRCDEEGIVIEELEKNLKKKRPKFIYLMPTFQNPTGKTLSSERRKKIAELAKKHQVLILEDDVYYDLRYRGSHIPALHSFAPDHVIYFSSLSKTFAPAIRLGYSVMPTEIMLKVLIFKQFIDMETSFLTQALATEFLKVDFDSNLKKIVSAYGNKMEILLNALSRDMPEEFSWNNPDGGLCVWLKGPENFSFDDEFLAKAIESGVAFTPGSTFWLNPNEGINTMRLSFAALNPEKIQEGISRLSKLCKKNLSALPPEHVTSH